MKCIPVFLFFITLSFSLRVSAQKKQIRVLNLYGLNTFEEARVPGFKSMRDGRYYTEIDSAGDLVKKSFSTGETVAVLVKEDAVRDARGNSLSLNDYVFDKDEDKILLNTRVHYVYRRSFSAVSYVYDLRSKKLTRVSAKPVLHATLSPDGDRVAYVLDNNLFVRNLVTGLVTQVTSDGKHNFIINGNCDWVYEEEFGFTTAFQWSPAGDRIAYYRFDETGVPEYTIPFYTDTSSYPTLYTYKYPKAGEPNSVVSIHVFDLATGKKTTMDVGPQTDQYIPRIKWTMDDHTLCIYRMNRLQNKLELLLADAGSGASHVLYTDTDKWYIDDELLDDLYFLQDKKHFIIMNEEDGWRHLYLYDMKGTLEDKLTQGDWDVDEVAGVDEARHLVYFTAAYYSPMDRQLFSVSLNGRDQHQITTQRGWHEVTFNSGFTYFLDHYSTINTPGVFTIKNSRGAVIRELEKNQALLTVMRAYAYSKAAFLKIPNRDGVLLNAWMLRPPHFDSTKKYPVLFMNYGGPGSQSVRDSWGTVSFWQQMLAEKGYVIVCVDNTGTGFRGAVFKKMKTYLQLGWTEIHDQIDAARWLENKYAFIDPSRVGYWGWSFGGLMSTLAITVGADVFHTAIAVAPVTNWRYYDNIYTERYMRTPRENPEGYAKTSPIRYVDRLKGKFLLVHGTGDDNVHFQNSAMLSEALIQANKQFQQAYYPNNNHSIYGGNTRLQLFTRMTDFILGNL